jgi:hypothetical protein
MDPTADTTNQCYVVALTDDMQRHIMVFLDGADACRAGAAIARWRALQDDRWWRLKTMRDVGVGRWDANDEPSWREAYVRCRVAPATSRWAAGPFQEHGLGDRVAAPQMFLSPDGERLYNYGGWTSRGPQTDLAYLGADACEVAARDEEAARSGFPSFRPCPSSGLPAHAGGGQSLTPLWLPGGGGEPSQAHIASLAPAGLLADGARAHLILAFGGGLGGYRHEHGDWAVGVLLDPQDGPPCVHWVRPDTTGTPLPRCAHTATFAPARCFPDGHFPEGAVLFFGGHTNNGRELADLQLLCVKTWTWFSSYALVGASRPTHGHSAALVERDGGAYVVFVGGGTGSVLDDPGRCAEHGAAQVLEVSSLRPVDDKGRALPPGDAGELKVRTRFLPPVRLTHDSYVPGRHHTACRVADHCVVLYGGGHDPDPAVCALDLNAVVDAAAAAAAAALSSPQAAAGERGSLARRAISRLAGLAGNASDTTPATVALRDLGGGDARPTPRKFHAACSLYPWRPLLVIYGGWRNNAHFDDLWVLALGGDLSSYGTAEGTGDDSDDDELEIVVRFANRRERVLIDPSALEALVEDGRLVPHGDGSFWMNPPPGTGDPETGDDEGSSKESDDAESSENDELGA